MSDGHPLPASARATEALQALKHQFAQQLPGRLDAVRQQFQQVSTQPWAPADAQALHRLVHGLTGAAGTLGWPAVSTAARRLEQALSSALGDDAAPLQSTWQDLAVWVDQLMASGLDAPEPAQAASAQLPAAVGVNRALSVALVTDDPAQAAQLVAALSAMGYTTQVFPDLAALEPALLAPGAPLPSAVVLDLGASSAQWVQADRLSALGLGRHGRIPLVVALEGDGLALRLSVTRAGAHRTLARPIEPDRLGELLDALTGRQPPQPYRVLLVDDDPLLLEAHASVLRQAGMAVQTLSKPLQTLDALGAFAPDVLLLDVYMPEASGPELAAALRERDAYLQLPIVFLSAETDMTQQLLALNLGGDDFLVKPVQPEHLVAAVAARARRARQSGAVRLRLQTALYEREREHLALGQHASVSITDQSGRIGYANERFCQNSGYSLAELLGQNHRLLRSNVHGPGFYRNIWTTIASGQVWHGEICSRRKDGCLYWVEATITPFVDPEGRVYQYVSIQTDISHIKAAEAALRMQRDMQRMISVAAARLMAAPVQAVPAGIDAALRDSGEQMGADRAYLFVFSRDGQRMSNAHAWCAPGIEPDSDRMSNTLLDDMPWMRAQFTQQGFLMVADTAQLPPEAAAERLMLERRQARALLAIPLQKGGQMFGFIAFSVVRGARAWTSEEVDLLRVLCDVIASAMARKRAELALRRSESRLNFLVSSSPVTIYTRAVLPPHHLAYMSPNLQQLTGWGQDALTADADAWLDQVHPDDRADALAALPLVLTHQNHLMEYRFRTLDGSYRWVHDQRRLVCDAAGEPLEIIGYWMDITERKRIEHELHRFNHELEQRVDEQTRSVIESERLARATLDAMSARVVILGGDGTVLAANRAWDAMGASEMVREGSNYLEVCDSACGPEAADDQVLSLGIRSVIEGEVAQFLHEYICRRSAEPQWFLCRVERFPGDSQVRAVVSHENITHLKQAERQQLRSQRLESLGTLAGGVAHDLNNALAPVLMGMNLLKGDYPQEAKLLSMIEASAQRGADMVRHLLTFAKGADGDRAPVQPQRLVRELEGLIKGSFPKNLQLEVHCDQDLPTVLGDATQLHQILLNLCVNARDAMPAGGTLSLRAIPVELDVAYARSIPDARPGDYVSLSVRDTGSGIEPHTLDRIFDPFFTTKSPDKGTGLGLSTVLGLVKAHGGFVQVYSQTGKGSSFSVFLPAAKGAGDAPAGAPVVTDFQGRGETILFVDDEAAVREVGRAVLTRLNFHPLVATDGADGLALAAQHRGELRAVITDLHMPHMDGLAFVRALRRILPDVPVVMASGRVDDVLLDELNALGVRDRLDKPFTEVQLAKTLKPLLDRG